MPLPNDFVVLKVRNNNNSTNSVETPISKHPPQSIFKSKSMPVSYSQKVVDHQQLLKEVVDTNDNEKILETLQKLGMRVYVISHDTPHLFEDIRDVIEVVSNEDRRLNGKSDKNNSRCLLYQDAQGRLYNLCLEYYAAGVSAGWRSQVMKFAGFQATLALTVLCRAFPCAGNIEGIRPAYLAFVFGMVLSEEISLSYVNAVMFIWGMPSVSAYNFLYPFTSDWVRKLDVLILTIAAIIPDGIAKTNTTVIGVGLTCMILCSNLGSRAWKNLQLNALRYNGIGASIVAYIASILIGFTVPYMGYHEIEAGGKKALEIVLRSALFVAIFFIISDFDEVQSFIISGSEKCNQDIVNIAVGIWFICTTLLCIYFSGRIARHQVSEVPDEASIVVRNEHSPIGYCVTCLPNFPINITLFAQPNKYIPIKVEIFLGVIMSIVIGGLIIFMGFTDKDDAITSSSFTSN